MADTRARAGRRRRRRRDRGRRSTRLVAHEAGAAGRRRSRRRCTRRASRRAGCAPTCGRFERLRRRPTGRSDLRAELRWLGAELGAVRDIEVLRDRLRAARRAAARRRSRRGERRASAGSTPTAQRRGPTCSRRCAQPRYAQLRAHAARRRAPDPALTTAARNPRDRRARRTSCAAAWKQLRRAVDELGDDPARRGAARGARPRQAVPVRGRGVRAPVFGRPARESRATRWPTCRTCSASTTTRSSPSVARARPRTSARRPRRTRSGCSREIEREPRCAARAAFPGVWRTRASAERCAAGCERAATSSRPRAASSPRAGRAARRGPRRAPAALRRLEPAQGQGSSRASPPRTRPAARSRRRPGASARWARSSRPSDTSTGRAGPRWCITGG